MPPSSYRLGIALVTIFDCALLYGQVKKNLAGKASVTSFSESNCLSGSLLESPLLFWERLQRREALSPLHSSLWAFPRNSAQSLPSGVKWCAIT